jgi:hypothetical protein
VVVDDHDHDFIEDFDVAPTSFDVGHAAGVEDQVKSLQKEEQLDLEVRKHVKKRWNGNKHDFSQYEQGIVDQVSGKLSLHFDLKVEI